MKDYYGQYRNELGNMAWREATYPNDVVALDKMKTLALKKEVMVDSEIKEKIVYYDLYRLTCGKRVIFNG